MAPQNMYISKHFTTGNCETSKFYFKIMETFVILLVIIKNGQNTQ